MMTELVEHYRVRTFSALLKRENYRSVKLLERLYFSFASVAEHVEYQVELDELLMLGRSNSMSQSRRLTPIQQSAVMPTSVGMTEVALPKNLLSNSDAPSRAKIASELQPPSPLCLLSD